MEETNENVNCTYIYVYERSKIRPRIYLKYLIYIYIRLLFASDGVAVGELGPSAQMELKLEEGLGDLKSWFIDCLDSRL